MGRGKAWSHKQPDWMRHVEVGDVLETRGGKSQRIVRYVSHYASGDLYCVGLTIMRCSWTKRCYTILCYSDLIYRGYTPTGVRMPLDGVLDAHIDQCMSADRAKRAQHLDCCDVNGIP